MGSNDPIPVDFRVIAASKPNLTAFVETGQFHCDLLYRLRGVSLRRSMCRYAGRT
jgi:two-component system C4-dicarboxylate transport response regulator DctD